MLTAITRPNPDQAGNPGPQHSNRTTGPATRHHILATLHKALADAVIQHLRMNNPADHIHLPTAPRPKARLWTDERVRHWQATAGKPGPVMVWTPQQTGAFLDHAQAADPDLYPLWHLIAYCGLRRGEAVGLLTADVDLNQSRLFITNQITTIGWHTQAKPPKTPSGDRVVVLDTATTKTLRSYQARQADRRATADPPWPDTGLFFTRPDGTPWHPGVVSHPFKHLIKQSGLPPIRLHDLRHGAATLAHAAGGDLTDIQHMLGHSGIAVTADTYTMILPERARDLAEAIAAIVPRTRPARPRRRLRRDHGNNAMVQVAPETAATRAVRTRREPIRPAR
jgi:integrase